MPKQTAQGDVLLPRRPQRANGRARFDRLVRATEAVMARDGIPRLTIQAVAEEAETPMASIYHFFPTPAAAAIAVAEDYLAQLAELIDHTAGARQGDEIEPFILALQRATVAFYNRTPLAGLLFFDSEYAWHIRRADLANNRRMAATIAASIAQQAPGEERAAIEDAVEIAISLGDAVWSLSFTRHGAITPELAAEAERAVTAYILRAVERGP